VSHHRGDPESVKLQRSLGRNVLALAAVSFFTDVSSEMIYPLLPVFLTSTLGASPQFLGAVEGAAESTAALLKLASGWLSDRMPRRKPLVLLGYTIASVVRPLVALAQTAGQVMAIRLVDRVGRGIRNSPRDALIADSVDPSVRGQAFGFHRAADHAGGVVGPLVAFALLTWWQMPIRNVFWLAAIPGALAVLTVIIGVREKARGVGRGGRDVPTTDQQSSISDRLVHAPTSAPHPLPARFWKTLIVVFVFTLGNSTDAFLLLRATELGVPIALAPVLWAVLHVVKSASSTPGGALSDRLGRAPTLVAGWLLYASVYLGFAIATDAWHAWALFALYGIFFGLTEGTERALVADLVPLERRGTAYGWFYLAIGLGMFPASLIFGAVWTSAGAPTAFIMGASLALVAAIGILFVGVRSEE
jgi:MFS family permease